MLSQEDANRTIAEFIKHYNHQRLHSAIGYVTPHDKLTGRDSEIHRQRDQKLADARQRRADNRKKQIQMENILAV